ncbi:MAG TPA: hypothetical protein VLI54_02455 [Bacillota bacterium]|nr:hypothetical protein [Bacillota bacterium]
MNPEQPFGAPPAPDNYEFIVNAQKPPKQSRFKNIGSNSLIMKLVFVIGGAVLLLIITFAVVNLFFGDKTNLDDIVGITATETELVRVSKLGTTSGSSDVRAAAASTLLTASSQQGQWITYLATLHRKVTPKELSSKKDKTVETRLAAAQAATSFNTVYVAIMRTDLTNYANQLKTAYNNSAPTSKKQRALLNEHYKQVVNLLKVWPQ